MILFISEPPIIISFLWFLILLTWVFSLFFFSLGKGLSVFISLKKILSLLIFILYFYVFSFFIFLIFIYLFLAVLGLHCYAGFSLIMTSGGSSLIAVWGLLFALASSCCVSSRAFQPQQLWHLGSIAVAPGLRSQAKQQSCTGWAALRHVRSSRPGIESTSPAVASGFLTTEPPGKPLLYFSFLLTLVLICSFFLVPRGWS